MPEIEVPLRTYLVKYTCDEAGCDGEVVAGDTVLTSNRPQYPSICKKCKKGYRFNTRYPAVKHQVIEV